MSGIIATVATTPNASLRALPPSAMLAPIMNCNRRGTAVRSMLDILGIEDNEKRVILTIANRKKTKEFIREQKRRLFIEE